MAAGLYSTVLITIAVVISGIMGIMVLLASAFLVRASMKLKRSREAMPFWGLAMVWSIRS